MTIGVGRDIRAMQFEDVQAFFRTYYHPSNASLVLAGDIDTERAFDLAERYFGELAPGARPAPVTRGGVAGPREAAAARGSRRDAAALHGVAFARDVRARRRRDGLVADLLANGKTSRLYRTLVYEQRIALDVSASRARASSAASSCWRSPRRPGDR